MRRAAKQEVDPFFLKGRREKLVQYLQTKGISDIRILEAFRQIPRHLFMPAAYIDHAYDDRPFSIDEGQTISQPFTVAFQTQLLNLNRHDKVLEIGTGSGFQCAILAAICSQVYSIEIYPLLHEKAAEVLKKVNLSANLLCGDGSQGWPEFAPFDKILITAGAPETPTILLNQLTIGGTLVAPVGPLQTQQMMRYTRVSETNFKSENFGSFKFVPLRGKQGWDAVKNTSLEE